MGQNFDELIILESFGKENVGEFYNSYNISYFSNLVIPHLSIVITYILATDCIIRVVSV